jgi:DNA-directed RNA polymerase specialized sigma24 family protein
MASSPTRTPPRGAGFDEFVIDAEPRLRRALGAGYGPAVGREATLEALVWAWNNWERLNGMSNPIGYLYRVGQTAARRGARHTSREQAVDPADPMFACLSTADDVPDTLLRPALAALSTKQRTAVVLVHGFAVPLREVAETMNISVASVREHTRRALEHLRVTMEVADVH